jgi:Leucine-rich repeat (LRR) protein
MTTFDIVWGLTLKCNYAIGWSGEYSDYDYGDYNYGIKDEWFTICELKNIQILQKDRAQMIEFDGTEEERGRIKELKIFESTVEYIPKELKLGFPNLKSLFVNGCNNLEEIDNSFFETAFDNIESLTIMRNKASNSPMQHSAIKANPFEKLPGLKMFHFDEKMIEILSENTFKGSRKLKEISFFTNRIEVVPTTLFRNLRELESVNLGSNFIENLDADLFKDNWKLKSVDFMTNKIESIPDRLFRNLFFLKEVNFSYNRINSLNAHLFKTNRNLKFLHFRINKIATIEPDSFKNLRRLQEVDFYSNACISDTLVLSECDILKELKKCFDSWSDTFKTKQNNTKNVSNFE